MKIWQPIKWVVALPALIAFVAGFVLTFMGLALITAGKYLVTLVDD